MIRHFVTGFALPLVVMSATGISAQAQDMIGGFYAGKSIDVVIPSAPGGSYDLYSRLVARNLGKHLPGNPTFVPRNMPGAGGVTAANHLYIRAARDGTVIGGLRQELALEQVLGNKSVRYDAMKFQYIGRTNVNVAVHVVKSALPVKSIEDVKSRDVVTGAEGARALPASYPRALNRIVGTKWKIVTGYKGGGATRLAFEKGEVEATVGPAILYKKQLKKWLDDGTVRAVVQYAPFRYELFPDVPTMVDLARNDEEKRVLQLIASTAAVGRSFAAPPDVPKDRVLALRAAFDAMVSDKDFLNETGKHFIDIQPASGDQILKIMMETVGAPPSVVATAKAALQP